MSIIIVNYNTTQLVIDCVNSIYDNTKNINFEIIVVDNNSPDRSIENIKSIFPEIKLILSEKNAGFGAGNNLGNKHAIGKYLFLLNSDTLLLDNAVYEFFKFMQKTPNAGVCGGNLLTKELNPNFSFARFKPNFWLSISELFFNIYPRIRYKNELFYSLEKNIVKINGFICGADYFVTKSIFDKVNGFDEDFFMYFEEVELSYRIENLGYKFYILPHVKIIHFDGGSQNINSKNKKKWIIDSKKMYYKKTNNKFYTITNFIDSITTFRIKLKEKILNN
ncbi:glycosyltransferase family 2 protein [Chishuiella sp.]|uniref:glycosyltransferase family 2 protein n=1 Tax=Chishuiella sp. TaxID=1969467 RepID=UPI0028AAF8E4|nr:glycosyltransferase family 2 protein [Chishuiella sp.]